MKYINKYREYILMKLGITPLLFLLILLSLMGCKTIKESELIEIHDTVTVHHSDTVKEYVFKHLHDTLREYHNEIITLKENGDTAKHEVNNYYYNRIVERDSTDRYRSSIDSLKAFLQQLQNNQKVVEKKPSWWATWKWKLIALASFVAMLAVIVYFMFPNLRRPKS